ncbi:MAG: DMT family transporter [Flavobacteriales bacterium]|nr:DMT family transporter [Flavobacteriales bacterium]
MPNDKLKSYLHLHLIVFIWGFTAILGALIQKEALPLVWFRMSIAVLLVGAYLWFKKQSIQVPARILKKLWLLGVIIALHWLTFFWAIKVSNVSITLACISTGAFFTSLIEPFFQKRKIIAYEVIFGLLVVGGLFLIFQTESNYYFGIILALISAFLSALFSVVNGNLANQVAPSVISFHELAAGVVFLSLFLLLTGGFTIDFLSLSTADFGYLFLLSSVCTAYAFIASVQVLKHLTPYTVMLTINLEPIYGILLALILFGEKEQMNPNFYFGALIILFTVILNGIWKLRRK